MSKILITQNQPFKFPAEIEFLGVYAGAVAVILNSDFAPPPDLRIAICPSSLKRHAPTQAVAASSLLSLPSILEQLAWGELQVHWQTADPIARTEALELCLAALALEWRVGFSAADSVLPMLAPDQAGVKAFQSLPMFGLEYIGISASAAQNLSPTALVLPWQISPAQASRQVVI